MNRYRLRLKQSASRELQRLGQGVLFYERVRDAIHALAEDPRSVTSKKHRGRDNQWRRPVGDYRLVYTIDDNARVVTIVGIGHRKDIYR